MEPWVIEPQVESPIEKMVANHEIVRHDRVRRVQVDDAAAGNGQIDGQNFELGRDIQPPARVEGGRGRAAVALNYLRMEIMPEHCLPQLLPVSSGLEILPLTAQRFEPSQQFPN